MKLLLLAIFLASCSCIRLGLTTKYTLDYLFLRQYCEVKQQKLSCSKVTLCIGYACGEWDCGTLQNSGASCVCDENCYSGKCQNSQCVETSA